jgi:hypothetical protein
MLFIRQAFSGAKVAPPPFACIVIPTLSFRDGSTRRARHCRSFANTAMTLRSMKIRSWSVSPSCSLNGSTSAERARTSGSSDERETSSARASCLHGVSASALSNQTKSLNHSRRHCSTTDRNLSPESNATNHSRFACRWNMSSESAPRICISRTTTPSSTSSRHCSNNAPIGCIDCH